MIALITFGASFVANAQAGGNIAGTGAEGGTTKVPWRGSSLSYGHSLSAMTFAPNGDPFPTSFDAEGRQTYLYNPTWAHNLLLLPEWHFNDLFFARGRLWITQEFTQPDGLNRRYEVEFSDALLDVGTTGWQEKLTKIRLSGNVRFGFPSSKLSQLRTQFLSIGPAAVVSRSFPVLSGLTVAYVGRVTGRFTSRTTHIVNGPTYATPTGQVSGACRDPQTIDADCVESSNIGVRSPFLDLNHGATVSFAPHEAISVDLTMLWTRQWLRPVTSSGQGHQLEELQVANAVNVRDTTWFIAALSWQFSKPVGVSLTAFTLGNQLGSDGKYQQPFFNRNTTFYLDLIVSVEAITSLFYKPSQS